MEAMAMGMKVIGTKNEGDGDGNIRPDNDCIVDLQLCVLKPKSEWLTSHCMLEDGGNVCVALHLDIHTSVCLPPRRMGRRIRRCSTMALGMVEA